MCNMKHYNLNTGDTVGADPNLFGAQRWIDLEGKLDKEKIQFKSETTNLIDQVWTEENGRPSFEVNTKTS